MIRAKGSGEGLPKGWKMQLCALCIAKPIGVKHSGFVEGMSKSNLAKDFFWKYWKIKKLTVLAAMYILRCDSAAAPKNSHC